MATRDELTALVAEGWSLVPLLPRSKRAADDGWLERLWRVEDFTPDMNVGAKTGAPSSHRVDIDCDAKEAVAAARVLLPMTRAHGRRGKPYSHFWFVAPGAKTAQFKDLTGEMLVELRSTGVQTVIPPSVHESGDLVVWENHHPFLTLTPEEAYLAATRVAMCALFARHWPAGSRHVAAGHLGGVFARFGFEAAVVERMVRAIAQIAGDEEVEDRARFARESAEKQQRGEATTGAPGIKAVFARGDELVKRVFSWMQRDGDVELDELNALHFVVRVGKDMCVGTETDDGAVDLQTFEGFRNLYFNRYVGKKKLGQFWLEHPHRRTFRRMVFAPPGAPPASPYDYNLWRGFSVEPKWQPTAIARYLDHTHEILCNANADATEWVLDFMADIVQAPGTRLGKALAFRGPQGTGKSLFCERFGQLFGPHFISVSSREQLVGKFNTHLSARVLVFADEAIWGGNRQDVGTLKHLITQNTINVQPKGIDIMVQPNYIHLMLATNEQWVFPAGNRERRGVILDVTKHRPQSYFDALFAEMDAPTFLPALLAFFQARPIDYTRLRRGLDTEALREQQTLSADAVQQWWHMMLEEGPGIPELTWGDFLSSEVLYTRFTEDMGSWRGAGVTQRGTRAQFFRRLLELLPNHAFPRTRMVPSNIAPLGLPPVIKRLPKPGVLLPSLGECRAAFDKITGMQHTWPAVDEVEGVLPLPEETTHVY